MNAEVKTNRTDDLSSRAHAPRDVEVALPLPNVRGGEARVDDQFDNNSNKIQRGCSSLFSPPSSLSPSLPFFQVKLFPLDRRRHVRLYILCANRVSKRAFQVLVAASIGPACSFSNSIGTIRPNILYPPKKNSPLKKKSPRVPTKHIHRSNR